MQKLSEITVIKKPVHLYKFKENCLRKFLVRKDMSRLKEDIW